ncbi:MAG: hypothetical protein PHU68_05965 [Paludibacter sp.]|nr:hypothetical protein [Paludibacter sp.]
MDELNSFQIKVLDWLQKPINERDLDAGATLLLQITRNRILHQNVVRRKNFEKIEYVLKKYMNEHKIEIPQTDAGDDTEDEDPANENLNPLTGEIRGKRNDHDSLPDEIQMIFIGNTEKYHMMRSLHEKLKLMSEDDKFSVEDRKPLLDELLKLDKDIRDAWEKYDAFKIDSVDVVEGNSGGLDVQTVQKHRTYISRTAKMSTVTDKVKYECLKRYNELISGGQNVEQKIVDRLIALGVIPSGVDEQN